MMEIEHIIRHEGVSMNKQRRNRLQTAINQLSEIQRVVNAIADEERDSLDSLPENFQDTDRGEKMQLAISALEDASEQIEGSVDNISDAMG